MPEKRRRARAKLSYPPLVQALLDGDEIEQTDEVHHEIVGIAYFGWSENVPDLAIKRAMDLLNEWREARDAD